MATHDSHSPPLKYASRGSGGLANGPEPRLPGARRARSLRAGMATKKTPSTGTTKTSKAPASPPKESPPQDQLTAIIGQQIGAAQQEIFKKISTEDNETRPAAIHAQLRALRELALAAATKALDEGITQLHWATALSLIERWKAGETSFTLASGRQPFTLPKLSTKQAREVERLVEQTKIHGYSYRWQHIDGEHSKWGGRCSFSIGGWEAVATWDSEEFGYSRSDSEHHWGLSDYKSNPGDMEHIASKKVKTPAPAHVLAAYVYLIAFELIDQHQTPFVRPETQQFQGDNGWEDWQG